MKNFIRRCVAATTISQLAISAFAQSWNLVWQEDFGVVPDSVYADFADPNKEMPGHRFATQWEAVGDGSYAIVSSVYSGTPGFENVAKGNWGHGGWWYTLKQDHTGNKNGGMLLCNTDGTLEGEIIYSQKIEFPICSTNKYKFVMYAAGSTNFTAILPSFEMVVYASDGTILGSTKTGGVPMLYSSWDTSVKPTWSKYEVEFDPGNYEWVEFKLVNRALCTPEGEEPTMSWNDACQCNKISCGAGNDFVLDDIQLFRQDSETVPDPDITNNSLVEESSVNGCLYSSSYSIPSKVLDDWHKLYKHIYFLWQESEDGYIWNDIDEPMSGIDKTKAVLEVDITKSMQYRVIITGADVSEAQAKAIAKQISKNGGPDDGCYLFSVSNTLSAALPKPDCKYRSNLRVLWNEDFGLCDTLELKSHPNAVGTFYKDDGIAEFNGGKYVITSCPSLAISQKNSWNKTPEENAVNAKDSKGKDGGAFLYGKTSLTDTVIYEKDFNGPFCNCKAYMFNVDIFKNKDWGTLPIHIEVLDGNDVIGEASGSIGGDKGGWITLSAPFQLPSDFNKSVKLRVSNIAKFPNANKDVSFGIDNLSVAICGETMPDASVFIDGKKSLTLLSGFDCNDETPHTVDFDGIADWKDQYPNASFIWQSSVDGGNTWDNISATTTSIAYEGEPEILYRVVIGESSAVAEEVARNGKPADGCSIFFITNEVGFQCKESGCRAPKFSLEADEKVMTLDSVICGTDQTASAPENVVIKVFQTNRVNVDDFYMAVKGTGNSYGAATVITPAPTSTDGVWTISLPMSTASYQIYAMNDTCKSDTLTIDIDVREKIELKPIDDQMFCSTEKPVVKVELLSGDAKTVTLESGDIKGAANFMTSEIDVPFTVEAKEIGERQFTAIAISADGKCKSEEIIFKMDYEDVPVFTFTVDNDKVCKSEKAELKLTITPGHNSDNHVYEIKGDDGSTIDIGDLVVFPSAKTKYTATASSEVCKPSVSKDVTIDVELPQAIDLSTVPSPALQTSATGNIVCAPANVEFTVSGDNLTTWDWEYRKKGERDFTKWEAGSTSTSNSMEITVETSFRVSSAVASSNVCKAAYSEIITIEAEKKTEFTLALDNERVCESGDVELSIVTTDSYDAEKVVATANGLPISLTNGKYKSTITTDTEYSVEIKGNVCRTTPQTIKAIVDYPLNFTASVDKDLVCKGSDVEFTLTGETTGLVWYSSTNGTDFESFSMPSTLKWKSDTTRYFYASSPENGVCEKAVSETLMVVVERSLDDFELSWIKPKHEDLLCKNVSAPFGFFLKKGIPTDVDAKFYVDGVQYTPTEVFHDYNGDENYAPFIYKVKIPHTKNATYKIEVTGKVCHVGKPKTSSYTVAVEELPEVSLLTTTPKICEGEHVDLTPTLINVKDTAIRYYQEVDGVRTQITSFENLTPTKNTTYFISGGGVRCKSVMSNGASVDVEKVIDFDFVSDESNMICEGTEVTLSLDLKSGNPDNVIFTANGTPDPYDIVTNKTYKVKPAETTKYELKLSGTICNAPSPKTIEVKVQKQPKFTVSIDKTAICEGEDVIITPTAENVDDLEWKSSVDDGATWDNEGKSTTAQTRNPNKTIIYSVSALSDGVCPPANEWRQKVEVEPAFTVSFDANTAVACPGVDMEIKANVTGMNDNLKFEWKKSVDGTNFNSVAPTSDPTIVKAKLDETTHFSLSVVGKYCSNPETVTTTATIDDVPTMTLETTADSLCEGDEITLAAKFSSTNFDESTIEMKNGSDILASSMQAAMLTPEETMTATATASTPAGCVIKPASTPIFVDKAIKVEVPEGETLCEGSEVKLTAGANSGYKYAWKIGNEEVSNSNKFTYDGDESVNVNLEIKSKVCKESYDIAINVVPTPHIVSVEESGSNKFEFVVEGGSGAYQFDFGNGFQSSPILDPATYGRTYRIKVKDELGCASDTSILTPTYELEVPTSFTPNGDGIDDVWVVKNLDKYPSATVRLYDRFGKKLCDMTSAEMEAWDGMYNGRELPSTDYWYEIQIDEIDKIYVGHFTLIRGKD